MVLDFQMTDTREHKSARVLSATNEERQPQLHNPIAIRQVTDPAPANLTPILDSHSNASPRMVISSLFLFVFHFISSFSEPVQSMPFSFQQL